VKSTKGFTKNIMQIILQRQTKSKYCYVKMCINPLTPTTYTDVAQRALNIKIPNKNVREKPTNTPIIHSVY
jgi:hypothetical protein